MGILRLGGCTGSGTCHPAYALPLGHNVFYPQGLSIRKRFRSTSRHLKGKGCVISIQTIAGHTLFSCTVGDLGHPTGFGDVVSLDSWSCLEGMVSVVKRTGHSSFYVEKGMSAMGKTPKQLGIEGGDGRICGGGECMCSIPYYYLVLSCLRFPFLCCV